MKTATTLFKGQAKEGLNMTEIKVRFSEGVFVPLEKISIPEGMEFDIAILKEREEDREKAKKEFFDWVRQIHEQNKDVDPDIVDKEIYEAVQEVRKRK